MPEAPSTSDSFSVVEVPYYHSENNPCTVVILWSYEGNQFVQPNPPPPCGVFPARFVLELPLFVPRAIVADNKLFTLFNVSLTGNVTLQEPTIALAKNIRNAILYTYPVSGWFDVYPRVRQALAISWLS